MNIEIPLVIPPFKGIAKKIESMVRKAIYDYKMLENTNSLAVALSGGKDSLSLLYILNGIVGRGFNNIELSAIHIDGDFSCGSSISKNFLKKICNSLNIKFFSEEIKIGLDKLECYSCSRVRRKKIFDIAKTHNINKIAFGHHMDDNIQTLLMNLFHKSEFAGMMPNITFTNFDNTAIIRPFIYVPEEMILSFAKQNNFLKSVCRCPFGENSNRKKIAKIINETEEFFPNLKTNLSKSALLYGSKKALELD